MTESSYTRYTCVHPTNPNANRRADVYPGATQTANLPHACGNAPLSLYRYDGYSTPKRYGKALQRP
jgi:hypothetical protein